MATEEGVVHTAQEIADAFVEQYYTILGDKPHEARRLYVDASLVSRPGPDGTMLYFNSVEAINEQFLSCDYENTTFEVLSVDSQKSLEDGIFIMVIGFLTEKDNLRKKFSQIFYLARPGEVYVVYNDIFRYVYEEPSTPTTLPVLEAAEKVKPAADELNFCVPAAEKVKPAADELNKTELVHNVGASVDISVNTAEEKKSAEVKNVAAGANPPLNNGKVKHSDEKAVTAQKPTEPVAQTVAPQTDGAKKSFAAIVESMARNAAPFQVKAAPVQKPKYMGQPRAASTHKAAAYVSKTEKKHDKKIIEEPGTSVFVSNLPLTAMPAQLYELFKGFGPIKENEIQVRTIRQSQGNLVCFGFIAFESATSVQSVLQAAKNTPFMLADRKLRVKEKDVEHDGSKQQPSGKPKGGSKTQNGSAADRGDEFKRVRNRKNSGETERRGDRNANGDNDQRKSEGGAATQNGPADGEDEFKPVRSRRNRNANGDSGRTERRGDRNANGNHSQKNNEGGAPKV